MGEIGNGPGGRHSCAVASYPKSGRTWLSLLYSYYVIHALAGEKADRVADALGFRFMPDRHRRIAELLEGQDAVPRVTFTHALPPAQPYYALHVSLEKIREQTDTLMLLVRDPRNVVVSFYHHVRAQGPRGKGATRLPDDVGISEFLRSDSLGVRAAVEYMNQAAERGPEVFLAFSIVSYEDMLADAGGVLTNLLTFAGAEQVDEHAVEQAVERSRFDRMQAAERARAERETGRIPDDNQLRMRRGRSGSAADELSADDLEYLNGVIDRHLAASFSQYRAP
jgi:hypothetical protein